jgi:aminoglycoside N3'-acetyltransferase
MNCFEKLVFERGVGLVIHSRFGALYPSLEINPFFSTLKESSRSAIFPAFNWDSTISGISQKFISQNGLYDQKVWESPKIPFNPLQARIDPRMGILSRAAWRQPGAQRSGHPWHSWVALGPRADWLTRDHAWDRAHQPLERLAAIDGWVLLLGVSLKYCTAFHLAEEMAGRRPFIRWAIDQTGKVRRIRVGGCANWFEKFEEPLRPILHRFWIGRAKCTAFPLRRFLIIVSNEIRRNPDMAVCSPDCLKCRDARAGGPIE